MTGFAKASQTAILDSAAVGLNRTLYLALFKWNGTSGQGAGAEPNDDGTLSGIVGTGASSTISEVSGAGYARKQILSTDWDTAQAGALGVASSKQVPKASGGTAITWTASGGNYGEVCSWALYDASTAGNMVYSGVLTDSSGTPVFRTINDLDQFSFTSANPIVARFGDPAKVTDSTPGSQRTSPT